VSPSEIEEHPAKDGSLPERVHFEIAHQPLAERNESGRSLTTQEALLPTVPEIRYLLARLLLRSPGKSAFIMAWSLWRRRHQADAEDRQRRRRTYRRILAGITPAECANYAAAAELRRC